MPADTSISSNPRNAADLRGASALAIAGVNGIVDLVETVHATIARPPWLFGDTASAGTRGLTSLVYGTIRGVTRRVGGGIDASLGMLAPLLDRIASPPQREAVVAALNGVLGDHLAATGNPLAIPMRLRHGGGTLALRRRALTRDVPDARTRVLLLAHGLCMNDRQWRQGGHDHGEALARDLGYTPVYLHYNTGRAVADNGRELSTQLESLLDAWPVEIEELAMVCHSMGGLVARAACIAAQEDGSRWLSRLRRLVFLGTPHHGAPLEQAGSRIDLLFGFSPYTAPFARLGGIRSAGIRDLRHGNVRSPDAEGGHPQATDGPHDTRRTPAPLPAHVRAYAVAATTQSPREGAAPLRGDGLVRVDSAFGQHPQRRFSMRIPASRRALVHDTNHFELLGSQQVYAHLRRWLR